MRHIRLAAPAIAAFACLTMAPLAHAGTAVVVGPNGGSGSATVRCADGVWRTACASTWTYTTAAGNTWSGGGHTVAGPYQGHHVRHVTTPAGNTWYRGRVWR